MTAPNLARARRWGNDSRSDPVARYCAPQLGMTVASVEQLIRGRAAVNVRAAVIITAFRTLGDDVRLARFWDPMLRAYDQREAPPLVPAVWNIAQAADAKEDADEVAFHVEPSDANLERLIRSTELEVLRQTARLDALRAEQQRRGRA